MSARALSGKEIAKLNCDNQFIALPYTWSQVDGVAFWFCGFFYVQMDHIRAYRISSLKGYQTVFSTW